MKVSVSKRELIETIGNALKVCGKKTSLPMTSSVMIEATDGLIIVSASNIDQTYQSKIEAEVHSVGKALLPCKNLFEIINQYPENTIEIEETENRWFRIGSEKGPEFNIVGGNVDDFPDIETPGPNQIEIDGPSFSDMVKKTCFIQADPKDNRPHIQGVLLHCFENGLNAYSTDGSMASRYQFVSEKANAYGKFIVNKASLSSISYSDKVKIGFSKAKAFFETDSGIWGIRLFEGDFPSSHIDTFCDYSEPKIIVKSEFLSGMLKRAKTLNNETYQGIGFMFSSGEMLSRVVNSELGEFEEKVSIENTEEMDLAVNTKKMLSALLVSSHDAIVEFYGPKKPVIVRDGIFNCFIMPMVI